MTQVCLVGKDAAPRNDASNVEKIHRLFLEQFSKGHGDSGGLRSEFSAEAAAAALPPLAMVPVWLGVAVVALAAGAVVALNEWRIRRR